VNYHAANCLIQSALSSLDPQVRKERAIQAEKILNFILVQYPNLNGPQLVTDYHALLEKAKRLQGR
jgi:hypothetical protein